MAGRACSIPVVLVGYSTVEAVPVYHCCAGGVSLRVILPPRLEPPFSCRGFCGGLEEWVERAPVMQSVEVECASLLRLASRWGASLLVLEGVEPLAWEGAASLLREARGRGLAAGARFHGSPSVEPPVDVDVMIVDYIPEGYEDPRVNLRLLEYMEEAARGARPEWVEVNVYQEKPSYASLLPVVERLKHSNVPLHVHIKEHLGGGPVVDLYKKLKARIRYVYVHAGPYSEEDTLCPTCGATIAAREGGVLLSSELKDGACPVCGTPIPFRRQVARRTPPMVVRETGGSTIWYRPEALPLRVRGPGS